MLHCFCVLQMSKQANMTWYNVILMGMPFSLPSLSLHNWTVSSGSTNSSLSRESGFTTSRSSNNRNSSSSSRSRSRECSSSGRSLSPLQSSRGQRSLRPDRWDIARQLRYAGFTPFQFNEWNCIFSLLGLPKWSLITGRAGFALHLLCRLFFWGFPCEMLHELWLSDINHYVCDCVLLLSFRQSCGPELKLKLKWVPKPEF